LQHHLLNNLLIIAAPFVEYLTNFFFLMVLGFELGFALARQELHCCLSHVSSPFYSGYFGDGGLDFCPGLSEP
jgi:hypothetical protein